MFVAAAVALGILFVPQWLRHIGTGATGQRVTYVYDGDTIRLANGTRVRLIGIDCPEMRDNDKLFADARRSGQSPETIKDQGRRAFEFARDIVQNGTVQLDYDVERKDKYGRTLAYVWVAIGPAGDVRLPEYSVVAERPIGSDREGRFLFLNATLVNAGYARPMRIPPDVRHADEFERYYRKAKEAKRGLWGPEGGSFDGPRNL